MLERQRQQLADFLFGIQLILSVISCGSQLVHMLRRGTHGISMMMFVTAEAFTVVNLFLAFRAHQALPTRITRQNIVVYSVWGVLWGAVLGLAIAQDAAWDSNDAVTFGLVAASVATVLIAAKMFGTDARDPVVRGWISLAIKALPRLAQAFKIAVLGGAPGLASGMMWIGHVTITGRIAQLLLSRQDAAQERNRRGLLISEIGNEISWIVVTAAWLLY